jgi:hypothetical protein
MGLQEGLKSAMVALDAVLNVRVNRAGPLMKPSHVIVSSLANSTRPHLAARSYLAGAYHDTNIN